MATGRAPDEPQTKPIAAWPVLGTVRPPTTVRTAVALEHRARSRRQCVDTLFRTKAGTGDDKRDGKLSPTSS